MLRALKSLFEDAPAAAHAIPGHERRHLRLAVASLLHEATRVDLAAAPEERAAAARALTDLFGHADDDVPALLAEGRERAQRLTSYFAPVAAIKRDFTLPERVRFIEHLWRVAYADGRLDQYEDHFVRKMAHLLYVPPTETMLARNRIRAEVVTK